MSSGISGDTKRLTAVIARLDKLARGAFLRDATRRAREVVEDRIASDFSAGNAPDGGALARPVGRAGTPLVASGRLRASVSVVVSGASVRVSASAPYAGVHQRGAVIRPKRGRYLRFRMPNGAFVTKALVRIPARPFLPGKKLGPAWADALRAAAEIALAASLKT